MSVFNVIELKIYKDSENEDAIASFEKFKTAYNWWLDDPDKREFHIAKSKGISIELVHDYLESKGHTVREGISDGCYGARDNKSYEGLTVWVDARQVTERYIDSEGDELVNFVRLLEKHGELVEGLDGDTFEDIQWRMTCQMSSDNSYNYLGHGEEDVHSMFGIDFTVITSMDDEGVAYLSVKFHCGGDIRGNYSEKIVYKFDSIDKLYLVIRPEQELKGE